MKLSKNRRVFTDSVLEKLSSNGKSHVHYYDAQCSSLAVRVTATGRKSYKAFNKNGTPQFLPIAEVGAISLEDARLQAQEILRGMQITGMTPKEQEAAAEQEREKEKRLEITLGDALEQYLAARIKPGRRRSIKAETAKNMRREVTKYFREHLGQPLRSLTYGVIHAQHEQIIENHSGSVADRVVRNIGTLIRYIEEREEVHLFGRNPAAKVLKNDGHELRPRKTVLTASRFPDFFNAIATMNKDAADFLLISLFTGLRATSIKTLRWDLILLDEMVVVLTKAKGRDDEVERLPLSKYVVSILRRRLENSNGASYVFPHPVDLTQPISDHDDYIDKLWQAGGGVLERIPYHVRSKDGRLRYDDHGVPVMGKKRVRSGSSNVCNQYGKPLIHHDLRRTFCSVAAGAASVDTFTAMRLSLHESGGGASAVHADYVELEHLRPGLESISEAILRLAARPEPQGHSGGGNVVPFIPRQRSTSGGLPSSKPLSAA